MTAAEDHTPWVRARDRLRLGQHLAEVLMTEPEFLAVPQEYRELRALVVAGKLLDAAEHFADVAKIVDALVVQMFPPGTPDPGPPK